MHVACAPRCPKARAAKPVNSTEWLIIALGLSATGLHPKRIKKASDFATAKSLSEVAKECNECHIFSGLSLRLGFGFVVSGI